MNPPQHKLELMDSETPAVISARADALGEAIENLKSDLISLRDRHHLSQEEVGERLGMSQSAVSQFEAYDSNPTLRTVRRYALAVGARLRIEVIDDLAPVTTTGPESAALTWGKSSVPMAPAAWTVKASEAVCV